MQHSYEGLDHGGGFTRVRLLAPLANSDFRLLWGGMCISLLGDGVFMVALAWQAYSLTRGPQGFAAVGIAMTIPTIVCLLLGGAASDRFDRRRLMVLADCVRAIVVGLLAGLSLSGDLRLWQMIALAALYGAAAAFFDPAFDAVVPEVLPANALAQANSLDQLIRPLALRLLGPALGGIVVGIAGCAGAFGFDAVSFVVSAVAVTAMAPGRAGAGTRTAGVGREILDGWRYVRRHAWLWATFATAAVAYLLFMGPTEVLLPFIVRDQLHAGAGGLGLVFAAGGLGSLLCALAIGQGGLPRRSIAFMYGCWTLATFAVAGYGVAHQLWGLMLVSVTFNTLETAGTIAWATAKQRSVPPALLGRVSSLDWLISIGLMPLSFALTGPVSGAIGVRMTMIGAGVLGGVVTLAGAFVPGARVLDREADGSPSVAPETEPLASGAPRPAPAVAQ